MHKSPYLKKVATFSPRSRNRVKWLQGGVGKDAVFVKGGKASRGLRRSKTNEYLRVLNKKTAEESAIPMPPPVRRHFPEPARIIMLFTLPRQDGSVYCPYCKTLWGEYTSSRVVECTNRRQCGKDFKILDPIRPIVKSGPKEIPTAQIDEEGDIRCPHCQELISGTRWNVWVGLMKCPFCDKAFTAVANNKIPRAQIDSVGDVQCPHCHRYNFDMRPGNRNCSRCGKEFEAHR